MRARRVEWGAAPCDFHFILLLLGLSEEDDGESCDAGGNVGMASGIE